MRRLAFCMLLAALAAGGGYGAPAKEKAAAPAAAAESPASTVQASLKELERNATLGEALTRREGSPDELAMLQKLADQGVGTARGLLEKDPQSAQGQYLLGSWLLYAYRVVETERLTVDADGGEHRRSMKVVVQGLNDTPQAGLDALRAAHRLTPTDLKYLLDYGSALLDWDQTAEAMVVVRQVWSQNIKLSPAQEVQVALLMSDIHLARGDLSDARNWIYRALSLQPETAPMVARLKKVDALEAEAARASEEEESGAWEEESAPSQEEAPSPAPSSDEGTSAQPSPPAADEPPAEEPAAEVGD